MDDMTLLREYATRNSEAAFAELVSRRVGFVYSAALRQVRDPHLAGEITQAVFIILAQKAGRISDKTILTGWLFKTTRFAALAQMRAAAKRSLRTATIEKEFQMQSEIQSAVTDEIWNQMSPLLDEALASLGETDRQAVLLRFFENKSLAEIGSNLGTGEDTARKRVSRALEKLHRYFSKHGVSSTTAVIAGAISANSSQAAPVSLAKFVTAVAIAKGAAASGSTLTLIKGALKIMAWTKAKTVIVTGAVVLLAAGTTTVVVKRNYDGKMYSWRVPKFNGVNNDYIWKAPPQVRILPTRFTEFGGASCYGTTEPNIATCMGICASGETIVEYAYLTFPPRIVFLTNPPKGGFDFIANLPHDAVKALQEEVKKKFGLVGKKEMRETDVLILTLAQPDIQGFKPANSLKQSLNIADPNVHEQSVSAKNGTYTTTWFNQTIEESRLPNSIEENFQIPIIDETGLTDKYDFSFAWPVFRNNDNEAHMEILKKALLNQLGLKLVPTNMPIEMLVVEKVK